MFIIWSIYKLCFIAAAEEVGDLTLNSLRISSSLYLMWLIHTPLIKIHMHLLHCCSLSSCWWYQGRLAINESVLVSSKQVCCFHDLIILHYLIKLCALQVPTWSLWRMDPSPISSQSKRWRIDSCFLVKDRIRAPLSFKF